MKIREMGAERARGPAAAGPGRRLPGSAPLPENGLGDRLQMTGRSGEVQRARTLALHAPEIRQDMVDGLRTSIARGEYRVAGAQVLPRLLREQSFEARW